MATESKLERPSKWTWTVLMVLVFTTILVWASVLVSRSYRRAQFAAKFSTAVSAQPVQPVQRTVRTFTVGKEWKKEVLPTLTNFCFQPLNASDTLLIRTRSSEPTEVTKNAVTRLGTIPDFTVFLKSKNGKNTEVVCTTWPKSSG